MEDADGTLIVNMGALDGGTRKTVEFAAALEKPHILVQVDDDVTDETIGDVIAWLASHRISALNVVGPRESKRPGIYAVTYRLLDRVAGRRA